MLNNTVLNHPMSIARMSLSLMMYISLILYIIYMNTAAELLPFSLSGKEQREVFREHHPEIQNMLNVDQVLPYLNQHKLLTIEEQEELQNLFPKRSQVISRLVIWIPRKGSDALWTFMVCLKSSSDGTAHGELVTVLQRSVDEMIKRRGQENTGTGKFRFQYHVLYVPIS